MTTSESRRANTASMARSCRGRRESKPHVRRNTSRTPASGINNSVAESGGVAAALWKSPDVDVIDDALHTVDALRRGDDLVDVGLTLGVAAQGDHRVVVNRDLHRERLLRHRLSDL